MFDGNEIGILKNNGDDGSEIGVLKSNGDDGNEIGVLKSYDDFIDLFNGCIMSFGGVIR